MTPIAADVRCILEAVLLRMAEPGCSCDGSNVCQACAAVEALERLARDEYVASLAEANREVNRCDA